MTIQECRPTIHDVPVNLWHHVAVTELMRARECLERFVAPLDARAARVRADVSELETQLQGRRQLLERLETEARIERLDRERVVREAELRAQALAPVSCRALFDEISARLADPEVEPSQLATLVEARVECAGLMVSLLGLSAIEERVAVLRQRIQTAETAGK